MYLLENKLIFGASMGYTTINFATKCGTYNFGGLWQKTFHVES